MEISQLKTQSILKTNRVLISYQINLNYTKHYLSKLEKQFKIL